MAKYAAAIDQGTTSTRFMIFDHGGKVVEVDQREHEQMYPKPGWVEHDPMEIWQRTQEVVKEALAKSKVDPTEYVMIEHYASAEAREAHGKTDYFRASGAKIGPCLAGRPQMVELDLIV